MSRRLLPVVVSLVLAATGFVLPAAPATVSLPLPEALTPRAAKAVTCATNPSFTGRLTASSGSTTAVARITNPTIYGYISNVDVAWSCTASIRYSGIAWNTTATTGIFDWGNLINSTSVSCNYVVGSTDFIKANSTSTCPSSDSQYALATTLNAERVYTNATVHTATGQFSYAHSDCDTYHGSEPIRSGVTMSTASTNNRPDASNCDPLTYDNPGTSQTITYDATAPSLNFDTPDELAALATVTSSAYTVQFDATDAVAGFGGTSGWTLTRQIAAWGGATCGTFVADTAAGAVTTGTVSANDQTVGQTLASGSCYRWTLTAIDQNGNIAAAITSGSVRRQVDGLLGTQGYQRFEGWDLGAGDSLAANVAIGNVVVSHAIVSLPIRGSSVAIGLTYNSQDAASVGMGPGWRLNVHRRLVLNGDGTVTLIDADGARQTFSAPVTVGTVTTYTRPSALYATLVKDTAQAIEFTLTYRDQSRDTFDISGSEGLLTRAEDRFANGVTLSYVAGTNRIDKITDTAASPNRTIDFAYDASNRVSSITDWAYVSAGIVQSGATGSRRAARFFYDGSGFLAGWADGLITAGSCPTGGSHLTCLTYGGGLVTAIAKTQTVETAGATSFGTTSRTITTAVAYLGGDVSTITDAEEQSKGTPARTTFARLLDGQLKVTRPGTPASVTTYGLVAAADSLGRVQSVWRTLGASQIEQRTIYDATYPIEPASVTDNYGALLSTPARTVSYTYVASSLGLVARMTEPLTASTNRTTDYTYNANNDATQTIVALDGSGTIRTISRSCYDASCTTSGAGLVLLKTIANYVDGTAGNGTANAEDVTTSFQADAYGQRTRETRSNYKADGTLLDSAATGSTYDDKGNLLSEIRNYSDGTVTNPGDDITPNATTGARTDLTTAYAYDTAGDRVSSADPRRAIETAKGTSLAADDFITRWTYDPLAERVSEKTPTTLGISITQQTSTAAYDELGNSREAADFGGLVSGTESDRAGRATRTFEDPDGAGAAATDVTSQSTYDSAGRLLTAKDRRQVDDPNLGSTATAYDELGRVTDATQGSASSPDVATITHRTYDALDRTLTENTGDGTSTAQLTSYTYDLGGRALTTNDEFACKSATYDYRDATLTATDGLDGSCAAAANTRTVTNTYDGLARLTRTEVTSAGSPDFGDRSFDVSLDAAGRQLTAATRVSGTTATTTFSSDPLDETLVEARADGSTAKTNFDPTGSATDRCYWKPGIAVGSCFAVGTTPWTNPPSQVTTTTYDARNKRVALQDASSNTTTTYDAAHNYQIAAFYAPTASGREHQTLYGYDSRHRLTGVTDQLCVISSGHACSSTTATGSDTYAYDDNDNRTQVVEANGNTSSDRRYCYDGLNRLRARNTATACTTTSGDETYTYDDAGNRLTAPGASFTYSSAGQLASCSPSCATLSHDTAGRISAMSGWTYEYDAAARLVKATETATGDRLEFSYDGEGLRTQIREYTAGTLTLTRDLRYQGSAIVEEKVTDAGHPSGTIVRTYTVTESGTVVTMTIPVGETGAGTYLVTWNGHGDALALWKENADGTLTLANSYTYGTWGVPTTATHNGNPDLGFRFLYVGSSDVQWDDFSGAGLLNMHARHYSPAISRFLQPDPSAADANLYGYAADSPVTRVDPSGLESWAPNWMEIVLCARYPSQCFWWARASLIALVISRPIPNIWTENAYRHCIWQCLLTYYEGWGWAELWGSAHEVFGGGTATDHKVDYHNNYIGRLLGSHVHEVTWAAPASFWAWRFCDEAWGRGWLWTVRNGHIVWSDGRPV